jgi:hypothetical protein
MMMGEFDLSPDLFSAVSAVHEAEIGNFLFFQRRFTIKNIGGCGNE